MKKNFLMVISFMAMAVGGWAQKPALTGTAYDQWKTVNAKHITADGKYAAYIIGPEDGDGRAEFYSISTGTRDTISRASDLVIAYDGSFAFFKIKPPVKQVKEMRRQKKKKEELPMDSLGIYSFVSRKTEKIPDVRNFKSPSKASGWLAYQLEAERTPAKGKKRKNSEENGFTLVLKNLKTNTTEKIGFVKDYSFDRNAKGLLFSTTGNDSTLKPGVYWKDLQTGNQTTLFEGKRKFQYKGLSIAQDGTQAAFLVDTDTTKRPHHFWKLYYWKMGAPVAKDLRLEENKLPEGYLTGEYFAPVFSKNGSRLFFGAARKAMKADTTLLPEEMVQVEVWGTEDPEIYPQQKVKLDQERRRSYLAVADLGDGSFPVRLLGSPELPVIETADEGNSDYALAATDVPYKKMATWDLSVYHDVWQVDVNSGTRKPIAQKIKSRPSISPSGNYVLWFNPVDTAWYAHAVRSGKTVKLTSGIKVSFADEEDDHPDFPNAYGVAGWTASDERVVLYDRYDLWLVDPSGTAAPVNLTNGRNTRRVSRYLRLDSEEKFLDSTKDWWMSVFYEDTKQSGFAKISAKGKKLIEVVVGPYRYGALLKARQSDRLLFTRETFTEFPDVWTTTTDFKNPLKITNANPQQNRYRWGTAEPVRWKRSDGKLISGLLYKPEGFNPAVKYPMIVNFYERNSDDLYAHAAPYAHRSTINKSMYVSNGYVLFIPDVHYRVGYPGESAMECIMPGVEMLVAKGFIDQNRIGIQGHSWGGYQIAYMVTRTSKFRAAEAGAIVANMVSAYGGIRWETGLSRMFQYEKDQSRLGATLWEKPNLYLENSPIFLADKIDTPLLLLHNDADGAVPWYQGIEMYMALRRLNKRAWMLNYNGEPHWPLKRENRIDFQTRMMQFFDHYLKDAAAPVWMNSGIPATEKGINKGY
ncbi:MAG: S9 family peptidase [Bacteroidetes bacterium]|nr:S9 family peptidase [Bacteroidota bacterium]